MLSPEYETENTKQTRNCVHRDEELSAPGGDEPNEQSTLAVHKPISGIALQRVTAKPKKSGDIEVSNGLYFSIMFATLILPLIGIIIGFTYMKKNYPATKRAGKHWMIAGAVMFLINVVVFTIL